MFKFYFDQLM